VENRLNAFQIKIKTRHDIPMYRLRGYKLRGIMYGQGNIPIEQKEVALPETEAGAEIAIALSFSESLVPLAVKFDVLRSAGFSAYTRNWAP
jgi:hypothetical protein